MLGHEFIGSNPIVAEQRGNSLNDEHQRNIGDVLKHSGIRNADSTDRLRDLVEKACDDYKRAKGRFVTPRQVHDAMAELCLMANDIDRSIARIRIRIKNLPNEAVELIEERCPRIWSRIFKEPIPSLQVLQDRGFVEWAQAAPREQLLVAVEHLLSDGGVPVPGRKRPSGKADAPHVEPVIGGIARGRGSMLARGHASPFKSGRPAAVLEDRLLFDLAIAWEEVTGLPPSFKRTDKSPFGKFVHCVFDWVEIPGADQALRRFGDSSLPLKQPSKASRFR